MRYERARANQKYLEMVVTGEKVISRCCSLSRLLSQSRRRGIPVFRAFGPSLGRCQATPSFPAKKKQICHGHRSQVTLSSLEPPPRIRPTASTNSSSIRLCLSSIASNRLDNSNFPSVDSFSSVSSAVSGSNDPDRCSGLCRNALAPSPSRLGGTILCRVVADDSRRRLTGP